MTLLGGGVVALVTEPTPADQASQHRARRLDQHSNTELARGRHAAAERFVFSAVALQEAGGIAGVARSGPAALELVA